MCFTKMGWENWEWNVPQPTTKITADAQKFTKKETDPGKLLGLLL